MNRMLSALAQDTRFRLDEPLARRLAVRYGTPLYVIDERHFRSRIRDYRAAFVLDGFETEISYASKANSTLALLAIAYSEGCSIDAASEGELRAALLAGVPAGSCHLHGNNKSRDEIAFALDQGVGHIVADHFGELEMIAGLGGHSAKVVLRLAPGVDPITHAKISTGQDDTKFGFNIADGSAEAAVTKCLSLGLNLYGFHCHVGSQLVDPEAQRSGGELIAEFAVSMKNRHGYAARYINVGGGLGAMYTEHDRPMNVDEYCRLVAQTLQTALAGSGLHPVLGQEPGRSLIAESGVTLYTVGVVKTVPAKDRGRRTYVCVDGGLSDNPRPALYGSKYTVERVGAPACAGAAVTVSGRHCETDKLFEDVSLPADIAAGDLLQVLVTGAYNASMASNYNRYPRPAMVLIRQDGSDSLIARRDSWDEMFARERVPE